MSASPSTLKLVLFGLAVLALILVPFLLFGEYLDQALPAMVRRAAEHRLLAAATVTGLLLGDIVLPVPSSIVSTMAGVFVGFIGGAAASFAGMTLGCVAGYWLARRFGRPFTERRVGEAEANKLEALFARFGVAAVAFCRAVPMLAEASVLMAGVSRMRFATFLAVASASNAAISLVYAYVGAFSADLDSFLYAVLGAILLPLGTMVAARLVRPSYALTRS